jgi:hypothetical protein
MWKVPAFLNPSIPSSIEMVLIDQKVRFTKFSKFCLSVGYRFILLVSYFYYCIFDCFYLYRVGKFMPQLGSN